MSDANSDKISASDAAFMKFAESLNVRVLREVKTLHGRLEHAAVEPERGPKPTLLEVEGSIPPTTSSHTQECSPSFAREEKLLLKELAADTKEAELERARQSRAAVIAARGVNPVPTIDFENSLTAFYDESQEFRRMSSIKVIADVKVEALEKRRLSNEQLHFRRAHLKAEAGLLEQVAQHVRREELLNSEVDQKLEKQAVEEFEERTLRRREIKQGKAEKAARKEAAASAQMFAARVSTIGRVCYAVDARQGKEAKQAQVQRALDGRKEQWAHRTLQLASRHNQCLQHRRREVDELRTQLQDSVADVRRREEEEAHERRGQRTARARRAVSADGERFARPQRTVEDLRSFVECGGAATDALLEEVCRDSSSPPALREGKLPILPASLALPASRPETAEVAAQWLAKLGPAAGVPLPLPRFDELPCPPKPMLSARFVDDQRQFAPMPRGMTIVKSGKQPDGGVFLKKLRTGGPLSAR